jgi:hypothetical protein
VILVAYGVVGARSAAAAPPVGDPQGLALWARVNAAYTGVAGAEIVSRAGSLAVRFAVVLRAGRIQAARVEVPEPGGMDLIVGRVGSGTLARDAGSSCWRLLPSSDPRAIGELGRKFLNSPGMRIGRPRRTAAGWTLPVVARDGSNRTDFVFTIESRSLMVSSFTATNTGVRFGGSVRALATAPSIPTTTPRC